MIMLPANFGWRGLPVDVVAGYRPKESPGLAKPSVEKKRLLIYQADEEWFALARRPSGAKSANVSDA